MLCLILCVVCVLFCFVVFLLLVNSSNAAPNVYQMNKYNEIHVLIILSFLFMFIFVSDNLPDDAQFDSS